MSAAVVTLLTDFGYRDAYVGVMKGVIASRCEAALIDLTHGVPPGDIGSAAYLLGTSWRYFASGTVHVAVVDPGVGTDRPVLAAEVDGQQFVAPDNGLLSDVLSGREVARKQVVRVTRRELFLPGMSRTFHGRDVFAPIAAALARGTPLAELGEATEDYVRLERRPARQVGDRLEGQVVYVDRFGNLVTNIAAEQVERMAQPCTEIAGQTIKGLASSYAAVSAGTLLAIIGSTDRLEISISGGDAAGELEVGVGEAVWVKTAAGGD